VKPTAPEAAKTMEAMLKGAGLELKEKHRRDAERTENTLNRVLKFSASSASPR